MVLKISKVTHSKDNKTYVTLVSDRPDFIIIQIEGNADIGLKGNTLNIKLREPE